MKVIMFRLCFFVGFLDPLEFHTIRLNNWNSLIEQSLCNKTEQSHQAPEAVVPHWQENKECNFYTYITTRSLTWIQPNLVLRCLAKFAFFGKYILLTYWNFAYINSLIKRIPVPILVGIHLRFMELWWTFHVKKGRKPVMPTGQTTGRNWMKLGMQVE